MADAAPKAKPRTRAELADRNAALEARSQDLQAELDVVRARNHELEQSIRAAMFQLRCYLPQVTPAAAAAQVARQQLGRAIGGPKQRKPVTDRAERLERFREILPRPAPQMMLALENVAPQAISIADLAFLLQLKPTGGHWKAAMRQLRQNRLIETLDGNRVRLAEDMMP